MSNFENGCLGRNLDDHCCYINGQVCPLLEENTEPGFRWTCGLRRRLGSWDKVIAHPQYATIKAHFEKFGYNCMTWPQKKCGTCGYEPTASG